MRQPRTRICVRPLGGRLEVITDATGRIFERKSLVRVEPCLASRFLACSNAKGTESLRQLPLHRHSRGFEPSVIRILPNFESVFSNKIVVGPTGPAKPFSAEETGPIGDFSAQACFISLMCT